MIFDCASYFDVVDARVQLQTLALVLRRLHLAALLVGLLIDVQQVTAVLLVCVYRH